MVSIINITNTISAEENITEENFIDEIKNKLATWKSYVLESESKDKLSKNDIFNMISYVLRKSEKANKIATENKKIVHNNLLQTKAGEKYIQKNKKHSNCLKLSNLDDNIDCNTIRTNLALALQNLQEQESEQYNNHLVPLLNEIDYLTYLRTGLDLMKGYARNDRFNEYESLVNAINETIDPLYSDASLIRLSASTDGKKQKEQAKQDLLDLAKLLQTNN
jgi:hypothetical protein